MLFRKWLAISTIFLIRTANGVVVYSNKLKAVGTKLKLSYSSEVYLREVDVKFAGTFATKCTLNLVGCYVSRGSTEHFLDDTY